ncbi:hypothetical protein SLS58_000831 [Diplodia intermedia]|uniref:Uncharacterized protein n=1 Tax=Diplodia intermedia TaxID=856260 RepID=A0ABR3U350_9PEZI
MADKNHRSALDRFLEPRPPYPSLSPDIEIGSEGRAVVDTSNGVDEVHFLSCHPLSFNGPLGDTATGDERIDDYVHQFLIDRAKYRPIAKAKSVQKEADAIQAEAENSSTEEHDNSDSSSDDSSDDSSDYDSDDDEEPNNFFDNQARTWRTVLKRREHAAIQYTTEALLTHELINLEAWKTHLLINATIRNIIYSTAYLSLESVTASALNGLSNGGLQTSPGIQVTEDVFIPVFIRPIHQAFSSPLASSNGNGSTYRPDYRAPATAIGKHPLTTAAAGYYHASKVEVNGTDKDEEAADNITVHASFCISCLRNLYACAVTPKVTTGDASASSDGAHCQPVILGEEESPSSEQDRGEMVNVVETGSGGNSSSVGWSAVNRVKMKEDEPQGLNRGDDDGNSNKQQSQFPAVGIPQLDGVSDPQSGGSKGGIAGGGMGCTVM